MDSLDLYHDSLKNTAIILMSIYTYDEYEYIG